MRLVKMAIPMIILSLLLVSCSAGGGDQAEELALEIRTTYIEMTACETNLELTADYGQRVYEYGMYMTYEKDGEMVLTVLTPENIAGVTARLKDDQSALEFDGVRLETGELSDSGLSPIDAIPVLLTCSREGFIAQCTMESVDERETLRVCYREPDVVAGVGQEICIWFEPETGAMIRGEISLDGVCVIQCTFTGFTMQRQEAPPTTET